MSKLQNVWINGDCLKELAKLDDESVDMVITSPPYHNLRVYSNDPADLSNCETYEEYYSQSYSYEEFKQSQDRIHRIGQVNKCTYIILQCKNSIDEKIYSCLQNKKNAVDELYVEMMKDTFK